MYVKGNDLIIIANCNEFGEENENYFGYYDSYYYGAYDTELTMATCSVLDWMGITHWWSDCGILLYR